MNSLANRKGVRTYQELIERCKELGDQGFLVDGLLPARSLAMLVGDSGLGKSPLAYQIALCVAAGVPFLNLATTKGKVLYADFENGTVPVEQTVNRISEYLGLKSVPETLHFWNKNDPESGDLEAAIRAGTYALVIIDSLSTYAPEAEEKNPNAARFSRRLKDLITETGCTFLVMHHRKKPSSNPDYAPPSLEDARPVEWLFQARGASALINNSDVRIGVDVPSRRSPTRDLISLVLKGFERLQGEIPLLYLARDFNEEGEAMGYRRVIGADLLPEEQRGAFATLPEEFAFKYAKRIFGRGDQATSDFLKKCQSMVQAG